MTSIERDRIEKIASGEVEAREVGRSYRTLTRAAVALLLLALLFVGWPADAHNEAETLWMQPNETFVWSCGDFPVSITTVTLVEVRRLKGVDATPNTLVSNLQVIGGIAVWRFTPTGKAPGNQYLVLLKGCDASVDEQCFACNGKVEIKDAIL